MIDMGWNTPFSAKQAKKEGMTNFYYREGKSQHHNYRQRDTYIKKTSEFD